MATRILGPTGSKRRKRFLLVPILLVACTALFVVGGAQAVHELGVYQLDGNAKQADNSTPPMPNQAGAEDANNICAKFAQVDPTNPAGGKCNVATTADKTALGNPTVSTRTAFVTDGAGPWASGSNDDQFTGGSEDDNDVSSWKFKNAASSNDKSDIQNAFFAEYTKTIGGTTHKLAYFGGDRSSNNGDENTAFWLMQNPVKENGDNADGTCSKSAGCGFTGIHRPGIPGTDNCYEIRPGVGVDINANSTSTVSCTETSNPPDQKGDVLVVSAFTSGGKQPNIQAYVWMGYNAAGNKGAINPKSGLCVTSACTVLKVFDSSTPGCDPFGTGDIACAITNQPVSTDPANCTTGNPCLAGNTIPTPSPWLFKDVDGTTGAFEAGDYLEAGLDLTLLGLGGECTSTFTMNTRSSQSVNASLQDLAVGQVGSCVTTLTTKAGDTANGGAASPTSIGTGSVSSGTDTATLSVSGIDTWGGTLTWYLCGGPNFTIPADTNPPTPKCNRNLGVQVTSRTVSQSSSGSDFVSGTATLTSAGNYCWTAHFAPDGPTAAKGVTAADDTGANECFTVSPVTPTLTTAAVEPVGLLSPTMCGGLADLNGDCASNSDPTADNGAVFYGHTDIIGGKLDCDAWGSTVNAGTAGNGSITSGLGGDNCTLLGFNGTSNVNISVVGGVFQVADGTALPAIFPNPSTPNDHSILASSFAWSTRDGRVDANGTETITGDDCSINIVNSFDILGSVCQGYTIPQGNGLVDLNDDGKITTADKCTNGCFLGHNVSSGFVVAGSVPLGSTLEDVASLTGTATNPDPNNPGTNTTYPTINGGTKPADNSITWTLYGPAGDGSAQCTTPIANAPTPSSELVSGDGTYGPVSYATTHVGDGVGKYTFAASYLGDGPNTNAASPQVTCDTTGQNGEQVTVTGSATSSSAQRWLPNDRVVLNSTAGTTLHGTLTVTLYKGVFGGTAGNCTVGTGVAVSGQSYGSPNNVSTLTNTFTFNTTNSTFVVGTNSDGTTTGAGTDGTYFWLIHYVDNSLTSPPDRCETSTLSHNDG